MKKSIISILMIALALTLTLTACSPDNKVATKTVRVIGTAEYAPARATSDKLVLASVDKVMVNGTDIKNQLVAEPGAKPGNNVTFTAEVTVPAKTTLEADVKFGYVFDEWEVRDDDNATADPALLEKIEDWLEVREHNEKLTDVPADYIQYIVAEYDRGYYVALDAEEPADPNAEKGSKNNKFTVAELIAENINSDELTLVVTGKNADEFAKLLAALDNMGLEELKLRADDGVELNAIPSFNNLEEVKLSGFTFAQDLTIYMKKAESEIELENCIFKNVEIKNANELEFSECTFETLTVTKAGELDLDGGKATTITILSADEVEIEDMTIGTLDLSKLTGAEEVELENVTCAKENILLPEDKNIKVEIK